MLRLSKFLAVTLDCLFRGKAKPCCIRDIIRQHCVLSEETPITPQMLINIKLCLDRMGSKIQQDTEFFMNIDPDRVQVLNTDDYAKLDRFAHDWLKAATAIMFQYNPNLYLPRSQKAMRIQVSITSFFIWFVRSGLPSKNFIGTFQQLLYYPKYSL